MAPALIPLAMSLAQHAPKVIGWMSGSNKAEAVAEQVIGIAEAVTGRKGVAAVSAIDADPAIALQFREAIMSHEQVMDAMYLADRKDARARDVAMAATGHRNKRADIMVAVDAIGLIACLVTLAFYREALPSEAVVLITTIASIFGLCLRDAHQYEFGSSRGSSDKSILLSKEK